MTTRFPDVARASLPSGGSVLSFHEPGGPLVAICGLVGGAGTSTLAYLVARRAARHSVVPVLLAELDDGGGLAALAGASAPLGLCELARAVDEDRPSARPFAHLPGGLRLVATSLPTPQPPASSALLRVLADARELHGLVVVDAGVLPSSGSTVLLEQATHVLFTLPASVPALQRAEQAGEQGVFGRVAGRTAALVAVATQPALQPTVNRRLRRLAATHVDRLLLVPHIEELVRGEHQSADARMDNTFAALATLLRRLP